METSREHVLKAVSHVPPEVVPVALGGIYDLENWLKHFHAQTQGELRLKLGLDVLYSRPVYVGERKGNLGIWGTPVDGVFGADGSGYSTTRAGFPLSNAVSVKEIEEYPWPDAGQFDYQAARATLLKMPAAAAKRVDMKYAIPTDSQLANEDLDSGPWIPLVCTLFDLFGLEQTLMNLVLEPLIMEASIRMIEQFMLDFCKRLLDCTKGLADFVYIGDDFSTQKGLLLSPELWRKYLKPTYAKLFSLAKSAGLRTWFHSCGSFRPVLPDLVDIGLDVWETVQTHLPGNDSEELKREFGSDITFFGGISTQHTLPFGTKEEVRREVRDRIRVLGKNGGYICGPDHGVMPDVPIENVLAMIDEARKHGSGRI